MTELPAPLVPHEVDLRDFPFTPIFRARLFGSSFHARANDAAWRAGVTLWLKSWDQVPAGTLPDDDIDLCRLAELGRDLKAWKRVKEAALHGWSKRSDGRLHHRVVAEGVLEAWAKRTSAKRKGVLGASARWSTGNATAIARAMPGDSKGEGEVKGQGEEKLTPPVGGVSGCDPDPMTPPPEKPSGYRPPDCKFEAIVQAYHDALPAASHVEILSEHRKAFIRARWREMAAREKWPNTDAGVDWFTNFFGYVARSRFLTGRVNGSRDRSPFVADLEWLMRPTNFVKVYEGRYEDGSAAA